MQVTSVFGLEFCPLHVGHAGSVRAHEDDMTFIGSAAALNRSWNDIEGSLADSGHRAHGYKCGVWSARM